MASAEFYTVRRGDTLSRIAKQHGTTASALSKINGITNPNRIDVGDNIALTREAVCKVGFQFLDRDRNPMPDTKVRIEYCRNVKEINTGRNGRVPDIVTDSPSDIVKVWIQRAEGGWKLITEVTSDWGNKLVTLTSPKIRIETSTQLHPRDADGQPKKDKPPVRANEGQNDAQHRKASAPTETKGQGTLQSTYGDDKGIKIEEKKNAQGLPLAKVTNDQAALVFLHGYTGVPLSEADYEKAASTLGCEVAAVKAVAEVESGGRIAFDSKNRPVILFERHKFHKHTRGKFSANYSWISSKKPYRIAKTREQRKDYKLAKKQGRLINTEYYGGDSDTNYTRLAKAYALDPEAAIMACSWGKFQVLGEHAKWLGYYHAEEFSTKMAISEKEHLESFVRYVKATPKALNGIRSKRWDEFAEAYNGKNFAEFAYDKRIQKAYEKHL